MNNLKLIFNLSEKFKFRIVQSTKKMVTIFEWSMYINERQLGKVALYKNIKLKASFRLEY